MAEEKKPLDVNISENTQKGIVSVIKKIFSKFSGNNLFKLIFFSILIILVLVAAIASYLGYITPDMFNDVLDTFLKLFEDTSEASKTASLLFSWFA